MKVVTIIGGGYSGVVLASNLMAQSSEVLKIIIVEKRAKLAQGVAYSTTCSKHLLNVPAKNMSAYHDKPDDFVNWLLSKQNQLPLVDFQEDIAEQFIPRMYYALYLQNIMQELRGLQTSEKKLLCLKDEVVDLKPAKARYECILASGRKFVTDVVVLATGNQTPNKLSADINSSKLVIEDPWDTQALDQIPKDSRVLIVGSGLTMIDLVLYLTANNHLAPIKVISRHGLYPQAQIVPSLALQTALIEGMDVRTILQQIQALNSTGNYDWRQIIDSMRSSSQRLWQQFTRKDRNRFLQLCKAYWDVHRHRIAPQIFAEIDNLMARKKLKISAGRLVGISQQRDELRVDWQKRGNKNVTAGLGVDVIINATGPKIKYDKHANKLISQILERKLAVCDDYGLSLSKNYELINAEGVVSKNIIALGPLAQGALFEIIAVPDIRMQCFKVATKITKKFKCKEEANAI